MQTSRQSIPDPGASCTEFTLVETDWGVAAVVARDESVVRLVFPTPSAEQTQAAIEQVDETARYRRHLLPGLQTDLVAYFQGTPIDFNVPVDLSFATVFGKKILTACLQIRYGHTRSYRQLAVQSGHAGAARAAGRSLAQNPIPIVIPCHRVIAADGSLGGYSAGEGLNAKRRLLTMESASAF